MGLEMPQPPGTSRRRRAAGSRTPGPCSGARVSRSESSEAAPSPEVRSRQQTEASKANERLRERTSGLEQLCQRTPKQGLRRHGPWARRPRTRAGPGRRLSLSRGTGGGAPAPAGQPANAAPLVAAGAVDIDFVCGFSGPGINRWLPRRACAAAAARALGDDRLLGFPGPCIDRWRPRLCGCAARGCRSSTRRLSPRAASFRRRRGGRRGGGRRRRRGVGGE